MSLKMAQWLKFGNLDNFQNEASKNKIKKISNEYSTSLEKKIKTELKYSKTLGFYIGPDLKWKTHILKFTKNLNHRLFILKQLDYTLPRVIFSRFYPGGHIGPTHEIHLKVDFCQALRLICHKYIPNHHFRPKKSNFWKIEKFATEI